MFQVINDTVQWVVCVNWLEDEIHLPVGHFATVVEAQQAIPIHLANLNLADRFPGYQISSIDDYSLVVLDHKGTLCLRVTIEASE